MSGSTVDLTNAEEVRYADVPSTVEDPLLTVPPTDQSVAAPATGTTATLQQDRTRRQPRVSVIIPTYNEAKNLPYVFARLPLDVYEVIVVDGRSVDDTVRVARSLRADVQVVLQNRMGKGNAMACGFAAATGDVVVMLDADGSADPREIPQFVDALVAGADFAKGTRFADGGGSSDITPVRAWGNRWLNRLANVLFGTRYTDLCYGYNAFWRDCLDHLALDPRPAECGSRQWGDGFEIETIINTRMALAGARITEVPSYEHPRIHGTSNLNTWRDGARVLRALLVERVDERRVQRGALGRRAVAPGADPAAPVTESRDGRRRTA
jgi:glycosyltransferase involved in cell wall biosynthesis